MLPGFWLTLAASVLAVVGAAAHVARLRREVCFSVRMSSASLTTIGAGVAGAVIGIGAAVVIGEDFSTNPTVTGSAVTFLSIILLRFVIEAVVALIAIAENTERTAQDTRR